MPKDKSTGKKLADMLYGNPERAAFGVFPQLGRRGQAKPAPKQADKPFIDERAMELPQFGDLDLDVPTAANRAMGQRMVERDVDLKRQADRDMSPLEKLAGGIQTGRLIGSGLTQAVKSIPTAISKGSKAAEDYIAENIYQPTQPKAYEYAGNIADFLTSLESDYKIPPIIPEAMVFQNLVGPATRQAGKAVKQGAKQGALNLAAPRTLNPQAGVIKTKGGNFLTGSVEGALKPLKRSGGLTPQDVVETEAHLEKIRPSYDLNNPKDARQLREMEDHVRALKSNLALDNWVDRNLGNYVKKEMATPEDPVRRLAEEGITHMPQNEIDYHTQWIPEDLALSRMRAGFPSEGLGQSNTAKGWEAITDSYIHSAPASKYTEPLTESEVRRGLKSVVDDNPWLSKLDPDTQVQYLKNADSITQDLRLDHIMDVLREDLTSGRIRPEQLSKVSMEQAVRRTAEYDQELAAKMNAARNAQREGLPVYKEYPEGYRWVELNKPGAFASESEAMGHSVRGYEPPQGHPDWVAGSGDRGSLGYGHGGWEAIKSGKAKVYSLVGPKGEPHVTVEVAATGMTPEQRQYKIGFLADQLQKEGKTAEEALRQAEKIYPEERKEAITQIKGKQNQAPNQEYLPFVQDFVKSGQWSGVDDIQNTGLMPIEKALAPGDVQRVKSLSDVPKYVTQQEADDLLYRWMSENPVGPKADDNWFEDLYGGKTPPEGMARGGRVHISDNPDVMMLELQAGGLVKRLAKGVQNVLPAAEREANKAKFLEPSKVPQRLYHGTTATEGGKGQEAIRRIKPSKEGALGSGVYLTPRAAHASGYSGIPNDEALALMAGDPYAKKMADQFMADRAAGTLREGQEGGNMLPVFAQIKNPLIIEGKGDPMVEALIKLGMDEDKAARMVERAYENKGYIGKEVETRARAAGYDGLMQYRDGDLSEVVSYNPNAVKSAIGNQGTYDINDPDLNKAAGGAVRMQVGGLAKLGTKGASKGAKQAPMKASEALGRIEGRPLVITQADRTKVGGGFLGGPGFSGLQLEDPAYRAAEAAWGVKTPGVAKMILGGGKAAGKDPVYAAMLGTPTQHQSNQMVFDKLYGDFKKAAKKGDLDQDLRDRINMRLANSVDKDGNPIFPPDVDILGKNFKDLANTFDRRAVTANLIGGMGVGGKKGQIIDYDKIIRQTTDPALIEAPTGAIGNRLFTLSGGIIDRPDLHPAFPTILQGEDLGVSFDPVVRELIMKDFMEKTMREKGRAPGVFDYTRGYPPSQLITEDILTEMQKLGKKAGGEVKAPAAQIDGNKFVLAAQKYGLGDDMTTLNKMVSLVNRGATVDEAARVVAGGVRKAAGGEITADDLILEERKL
jgi:hypothetical protein